MIYAKIENPEQEKRLIDELKTSKDKNWYRRLEVIANSTKGVTVEQLSKTFRSDYSLCLQSSSQDRKKDRTQQVESRFSRPGLHSQTQERKGRAKFAISGVSGVSPEKSTFESDRAIMALYAR
jgi:hypothetical protein